MSKTCSSDFAKLKMRIFLSLYFLYSLLLMVATIVIILLMSNMPIMVSYMCPSLGGCVLSSNISEYVKTKGDVISTCNKFNSSNTCTGSLRCCMQCMNMANGLMNHNNVSPKFDDDVERLFKIALILYILGWVTCFATVGIHIHYEKEHTNACHFAVKTYTEDSLFIVNDSDQKYGKTSKRLVLIMTLAALFGLVFFGISIIIVTVAFVLYLTSFDCLAYAILSIVWFIFLFIYIYFLADTVSVFKPSGTPHIKKYANRCQFYCVQCVCSAVRKFICCIGFWFIIAVTVYLLYRRFIKSDL